MIKRTFTLIIYIFAALSQIAIADELNETLQRFDKLSSNGRVTLANKLFSEKFVEVADTVFKYDNNVNQSYLEAEVYYWAAEYELARNNYSHAAIYINHALPIQRKLKGDNLADYLSTAGVAYTRLGDFSSSIKYQEECLALDRKSGDKELISSSLNNIAATSLSAGMIINGEKYIEEAINIERELKRPAALAVRLGLASEIYVKLGRLDRALQVAQEALNIEPNKEKISIRKSQLAAVYNEMGKMSQALQLLHESEVDLRKSNNKNSLAIVLNQLGNIEIKQGNTQAAVAHLSESAQLCAETGNLNIEQKARRMLCDALRVTNPAQALVELEKYAQLKDSIYSTEAAQSLAQFDVKYETTEKEHEIEILNQRVRNRNMGLIFLVVVLVAVIVISVLFARFASIRKKQNITLIKANLLKDQLLEIAQNKTEQPEEKKTEQITQLAQEMGSIGEMPQVKITRREREVMKLCCEGLLAKEIAEQLNISQRTVETHKTNLFKKLGINNTMELVRYAQVTGEIK